MYNTDVYLYHYIINFNFINVYQDNTLKMERKLTIFYKISNNKCEHL